MDVDGNLFFRLPQKSQQKYFAWNFLVNMDNIQGRKYSVPGIFCDHLCISPTAVHRRGRVGHSQDPGPPIWLWPWVMLGTVSGAGKRRPASLSRWDWWACRADRSSIRLPSPKRMDNQTFRHFFSHFVNFSLSYFRLLFVVLFIYSYTGRSLYIRMTLKFCQGNVCAHMVSE